MSQYIQTAKEKLNEKLANESNLDVIIKFDIEDEGVLYIDGTVSPPIATEETREPDVTISADAETMKDMFSGTLNPTTAYMTGKLRIEGDMSAAMKLAQIV